MGAGTNVQKKLIALHHLDVPWRPRQAEIDQELNIDKYEDEVGAITEEETQRSNAVYEAEV